MDYEPLRAEYDAAFDSLRAAVSELRAITQQLSPDKTAEQAARECVDRATAIYRVCRNNLAAFLTSRWPAGGFAASVGSQPPVGWARGFDRQAAASSDSTLHSRHEVHVLAHRLWEEAGRPIGYADEHWYRAEEMLRSGQ